MGGSSGSGITPAGGAAATTWPSTLWNLIRRGREGPGEQRKAALEDLFRLYYKPIYRFFQKALGIEGRHLDDVTQDFFTRFIEKDFLKNIAQEKSFRGFLKVACRRHHINWLEAQKTAKRGAGRTVSLQEAGADPPAVPERDLDALIDDELRAWYVEESVERLRRELVAQGKETHFLLFEKRAGLGGVEPPDHRTLSREFGIPVYEVSNRLMAARKLFRRTLVGIAAERCADPMEELRDLGLHQYLK
jgi:RNA polymerase sigma factor (sigma-70 family)